MATPNARHVVPNRNGGWDVKKPGTQSPASHHETQQEAVDQARGSLKSDGGGELRIHGQDGRIRETDSVPAGA